LIIYIISNSINKKQYVGQTHGTLEKRFQRHCWKSAHDCMPIAKAIKKYGREYFTIEEICRCNTQEELDEMEIYWVKELNTFSPNGYNLKAGQGRGLLSDETKNKISKINLGRVVTEEARKNLSESHKGWVPSEETRQKWRTAFKGKKQNPDHVKYRLQRIEDVKSTIYLISPDDVVYGVKNMKEFCKNQNLSPSKMSEVVNEKKSQHKGWKLKPKQ